MYIITYDQYFYKSNPLVSSSNPPESYFFNYELVYNSKKNLKF